MPIYDFQCQKCKNSIELKKSMDDETLPLCCEPGCDGIEMLQIISKSTFHLKSLRWAAEGYDKSGAT